MSNNVITPKVIHQNELLKQANQGMTCLCGNMVSLQNRMIPTAASPCQMQNYSKHQLYNYNVYHKHNKSIQEHISAVKIENK